MIRRTFVRRMMGAALASGLLGSELLARRPARALPEPTEVSVEGIRNHVAVEWANGSVVVSHPESVAEYGRRVVFLDATTDRSVNSADRAIQLAQQMIADTAYPRSA